MGMQKSETILLGWLPHLPYTAVSMDLRIFPGTFDFILKTSPIDFPPDMVDSSQNHSQTTIRPSDKPENGCHHYQSRGISYQEYVIINHHTLNWKKNIVVDICQFYFFLKKWATIIFPDLQTMEIKKNSGQYSPWLVMKTLFLVITRRTIYMTW